MNHSKLAFIGAGKMVSAIVHSLVRSNVFSKEKIICCSAKDGTSERLAKETGILRADNIGEMLVLQPDVLVLGCKPQQLVELSKDDQVSKVSSLVLSIMAGTTLERLKESFPHAKNIIRSMPNTPGQIGAGITGYIFSEKPESGDSNLVRQILLSLGEACKVDSESDLDRITAVSGSGPAYLFEFACALESAAKDIGMNEDLANKFAMQTIIGSAELIKTSGLHPEELRNQVTSPNGTTQAALENFSTNNLRSIVSQAVEAARKRSIELSYE